MKTSLKKFAPFGVYLAIISALVSFGLLIVRQKFDLFLQISLGFILIGLAISILLDPNKAREILTGRQAKYSSNTLVLSIAFIGILVVINVIANNNSVRWDFTEDKENTLTQETIDTIKSLPEKVTALAFFTPRFPSNDASRMLESYKYNSQGKFDYQFVDPDVDPVSAKDSNVTRDGTIVLKMAGRQEQVTFSDEQEITSALIRLANPGNRALYFLTGHGEYDLNGSSDKKISDLKTALESKNYTLNSLNLISTPKIPENALAIIIDRPLQPLTQNEVELIKSFVDGGKSILLLMEPQPLTNFGDANDPFDDYLTTAWGLSMNNDIIIDPNVDPPLAAVADFYGNHLITNKMQNIITIFPTARSLFTKSVSADVAYVDLIKTSQDSWGETDFSSIEQNQISFDQSKDLPGPITIAIAAENNKNKSRVVIIGDSDFTSDDDFQNYGNGIFMVNAVDWAAHQDSLIQLTPRQNTQRLLIPPQQFTMGLILFGSVFLMPLMIIFAGVTVFIQRRRRI